MGKEELAQAVKYLAKRTGDAPSADTDAAAVEGEIKKAEDFSQVKALSGRAVSIPVMVCEKHDAAVTWIEGLKSRGIIDPGVTLINFDTHPDAIEEVMADELHEGSWVRWLKAKNILNGRFVWVKNPISTPLQRARPEEVRYCYGDDVYDSLSLLTGRVSGPAVISIDYDYIAPREGALVSTSEIEERVKEVVDTLISNGIRPIAINFTYSRHMLVDNDNFAYEFTHNVDKITKAFMDSFAAKEFKFMKAASEASERGSEEGSSESAAPADRPADTAEKKFKELVEEFYGRGQFKELFTPGAQGVIETLSDILSQSPDEVLFKARQLIDIMKRIQRHRFMGLDETHAWKAYCVGMPDPIGSGQTISAEDIIFFMTLLLNPQRNDTVLEIGTGSGRQAAVLSALCKEVHTIERMKTLYDFGAKNLTGFKNVHTYFGDGIEGIPVAAGVRQFDKIMITAAIDDEALKKAALYLREGGLLVAPFRIPGHEHHDRRDHTEKG
ncbi:MAG: hypothetical protein NTY34_02645 [Candidatus Omnitrophica bacterium]|nr:hypothetical protein [Candidatus Omnitrophota bacterium]